MVSAQATGARRLLRRSPKRAGVKPLTVIEARHATDLAGWLDARSVEWRDNATPTVTDLYGPFREALAAKLPNAAAGANPFHVVGVANRVVDKTRRAVQDELLGHRGRKNAAP